MFEKQISQSLQDAIKKITNVSEALVGNQHKIDKNKNNKIDAHDFKLLKGQKAAPMKEEEQVDEQVDETIVKHDSFTVEIKESYSFADYLTAAKQLVGEEEAVAYANEAFKTQDLTIFIMEEMSRGDIEDNINAHRKAGHTVTMPKYSTKDGKPHAEYTVTDKDEGTRRKYIHHGNVRKVENMGAKG